MWAKQIATSDGRADNAEGMAAAMDVSVRQLEAQLRQRQQEVEAKEGVFCVGSSWSCLLDPKLRACRVVSQSACRQSRVVRQLNVSVVHVC